MIRRIEAMNYRCLRHVSVQLDAFHVLVGPNASGKSTFLDVMAFLGRLVSDGLDAAVEERTQNFYDLVWGRKNQRFELAVEAVIPEDLQTSEESTNYDLIRYEVAIGIGRQSDELSILDEQLLIRNRLMIEEEVASAIPSGLPRTAFLRGKSGGWRKLIEDYGENRLEVRPEKYFFEQGEHSCLAENFFVTLGPKKGQSVLRQLAVPEFPVVTWLAGELTEGIHHVDLNSRKLRSPCPPGKGVFLATDGSNLPQVINILQNRGSNEYNDWIAHVRTALPDLEDIRVVERPEDKHRYVMLRHHGALEVPSWMLSDGTLRLLALTVLPYIPGAKPVCLIEEPENSIHPLNIETVMQSLQSVYDGQVLVATHSPTVLAVTEPAQILVFSRDERHGTRIVRGSEHPGLKNWRGEVSMGTLFAGGVLG